MKQQIFYQIASYLKEILSGTCFNGNTYIVGGACRDILMNKNPKDIDICVELRSGGIELTKWLFENDYLVNEPVLFPTYGTSQFILKKFPDIELEAVQTRKEQYKDKNSRNPECIFGDIVADAFRRDVTINAIYYSISEEKFLDPTGKGFDDINNHIIRTTNDNPDIVFTDDALRNLRVVRFSTRYDWEIEHNTYESMKRNVDRLSIITKERIRDEFEKILLCKNAVQGIKLLIELGAMKYVIPELLDTINLEQNKFHQYDVFNHILALIDYYHKHYEPDIVCLLSCLLHDIGKIETRTVGDDGRIHFYNHEFIGTEMVELILRRLKYDNDTIKEVKFLVKNHMRTKNFGDNCEKIKPRHLNKLIYQCGNKERFINLIKVIECDNMSHHPDYCIHGQYDYFMNQLDSPLFNYKLKVSGNDIMDILKIQPGYEIKLIQDRLLKQIFNKPNISYDECIKIIPHLYKQLKNEKKIK